MKPAALAYAQIYMANIMFIYTAHFMIVTVFIKCKCKSFVIFIIIHSSMKHHLSLMPPKKAAPNITPMKKMVATALFRPLLSHTRSHCEIKRDEK